MRCSVFTVHAAISHQNNNNRESNNYLLMQQLANCMLSSHNYVVRISYIVCSSSCSLTYTQAIVIVVSFSYIICIDWACISHTNGWCKENNLIQLCDFFLHAIRWCLKSNHIKTTINNNKIGINIYNLNWGIKEIAIDEGIQRIRQRISSKFVIIENLWKSLWSSLASVFCHLLLWINVIYAWQSCRSCFW